MNVFTTLQQLVPQQKLSKVAGRLAASRHPYVKRTFIRSFAKAYNISLDEYERQSLNAYESFNDFFTRELKERSYYRRHGKRYRESCGRYYLSARTNRRP